MKSILWATNFYAEAEQHLRTSERDRRHPEGQLPQGADRAIIFVQSNFKLPVEYCV